MSATLTPPVPFAAAMPSAAPVAAQTGPQLYRFSIAQYQAMLDHGVFEENNRIELVRGLLMVKEMKNTPHVVCLGMVADLLTCLLVRWHVRTQDPLLLALSMPEPDLVVAPGRRQDWLARHPGPADIAMVGEVSDSTLGRDRTVKLAMYAEARVAVYWIVNLVDRVLEVRTNPRGSGDTADYATVQILSPADTVTLVVGGVTLGPILVGDMFP